MENNQENSALRDFGIQSAQITNSSLSEVNDRILKEAMSEIDAAKARIDALAKSHEEISNLAKVFAKKADELGINGDFINQNSLEKAAFDNQQTADYLRSRLADENFDKYLKESASTLSDSVAMKTITKATGPILDTADGTLMGLVGSY
jgi:hypothetical protein